MLQGRVCYRQVTGVFPCNGAAAVELQLPLVNLCPWVLDFISSPQATSVSDRQNELPMAYTRLLLQLGVVKSRGASILPDGLHIGP